MALNVGELVTLLGGKFDPTAFKQYEAAIEHARRVTKQGADQFSKALAIRRDPQAIHALEQQAHVAQDAVTLLRTQYEQLAATMKATPAAASGFRVAATGAFASRKQVAALDAELEKLGVQLRRASEIAQQSKGLLQIGAEAEKAKVELGRLSTVLRTKLQADLARAGPEIQAQAQRIMDPLRHMFDLPVNISFEKATKEMATLKLQIDQLERHLRLLRIVRGLPEQMKALHVSAGQVDREVLRLRNHLAQLKMSHDALTDFVQMRQEAVIIDRQAERIKRNVGFLGTAPGRGLVSFFGATGKESRRAAEGVRTLRDSLGELAKYSIQFLGLYKVVEQIRDTWNAAVIFEQAQTRLKVAVQNSGLVFGEYEKSIEQTTQSLRRMTGFTDYEIQDSFANAIRALSHTKHGVDLYRAAWNAVSTSLDVARTKNIGLAAATSIVARAAGGYYLGLTRLGIQVHKVTDAQDRQRASQHSAAETFRRWNTEHREAVRQALVQLRNVDASKTAIEAFKRLTVSTTEAHRREFIAQTRAQNALLARAKATDRVSTAQRALAQVTALFAGNAEAIGRTFGGSLDRLRANIDALREHIGRELLGALTRVVNYLNDNAIPFLQKWLEEMNPQFVAFGHSIASIFKAATPAVQQLGTQVTLMISIIIGATRAVAALGASFQGMVGPAVTQQLVRVVAGIYLMEKSLKIASGAMRAFNSTLLGRGVVAFGRAFAITNGYMGKSLGMLARLRAGFVAFFAALNPWRLAILALAVGIGILITQESAAERANDALKSSIDRLRQAYARLGQANREVRATRIDEYNANVAVTQSVKAYNLARQQTIDDIVRYGRNSAQVRKDILDEKVAYGVVLEAQNTAREARERHTAALVHQSQAEKNQRKELGGLAESYGKARRAFVEAAKAAQEASVPRGAHTAAGRRPQALIELPDGSVLVNFSKHVGTVNAAYDRFLKAMRSTAQNMKGVEPSVKSAAQSLLRYFASLKQVHGWVRVPTIHQFRVLITHPNVARAAMDIGRQMKQGMPNRWVIQVLLSNAKIAPQIAAFYRVFKRMPTRHELEFLARTKNIDAATAKIILTQKRLPKWELTVIAHHQGAAAALATFFNVVRRYPGKKVIDFIVHHRPAAEQIAAFFKRFGLLPTKKQLQILEDPKNSLIWRTLMDRMNKLGRTPTKHQIEVLQKRDNEQRIQSLEARIERMTTHIKRVMAGISEVKIHADENDPQWFGKTIPETVSKLRAQLDSLSQTSFLSKGQTPVATLFGGQQPPYNPAQSGTVRGTPAGPPVSVTTVEGPRLRPGWPPVATGMQPPVYRAGYKSGGKVGRPTVVMMGEEAPTHPEWVISTNPRDRAQNTRHLKDVAEAFGYDVEERQQGGRLPLPGSGYTPQQRATAQRRASAAKAEAVFRSKHGGLSQKEWDQLQKDLGTKDPKTKPTPLELFQKELDREQTDYDLTYSRVYARVLSADRTETKADDITARRAEMAVEQDRIGAIQRRLRDPRFRTIPGATSLQADLLSKQNDLYQSITTARSDIQDALTDTSNILTPTERFQLAESERRHNVPRQRAILNVERDRLLAMLRENRDISVRLAVSQAITSVDDQISSLTTADPTQVLSPREQLRLNEAIGRNDVEAQKTLYRLELSRLGAAKRHALSKKPADYTVATQIQDVINSVQEQLKGLAPEVDVTEVLSPRETYVLDEAQRTQNVAIQRRILRIEIARLTRRQRVAVRRKHFKDAASLSQARAQAESQLRDLAEGAGDQQQNIDAYLSAVAQEAATVLSPGTDFARTAATGAYGKDLRAYVRARPGLMHPRGEDIASKIAGTKRRIVHRIPQETLAASTGGHPATRSIALGGEDIPGHLPPQPHDPRYHPRSEHALPWHRDLSYGIPTPRPARASRYPLPSSSGAAGASGGLGPLLPSPLAPRPARASAGHVIVIHQENLHPADPRVRHETAAAVAGVLGGQSYRPQSRVRPI